MEWPTMSPDINQMEHVWDQLKHPVHASYSLPHDQREQFKTVVAECDLFPEISEMQFISNMR